MNDEKTPRIEPQVQQVVRVKPTAEAARAASIEHGAALYPWNDELSGRWTVDAYVDGALVYADSRPLTLLDAIVIGTDFIGRMKK